MVKIIVRGNPMGLFMGQHENYLNIYLPAIKPYFSNVAHCYQQGNIPNKNIILFYSYFPGNVICTGCDCSPNPDINIQCRDSNKTGEGFYESRRCDSPCDYTSRIYFGGKYIGFLCKQNNILSLTDIIHLPIHLIYFCQILSELEKNGYIIKKPMTYEKKKITLGTDPEMESIVDGKYISATGLLQVSNREKIYISHDGHTQPQRELRPDPSESPEELVSNIKDLIKISSFLGEDLSVYGRSCPLGGHIHIGNISPSQEIIDVLDYYLHPFAEFNSPTRISSKYGKRGDYRIQPHGFEYRTPPAAWLLTPTLALMTLQLTKNIVERIVNNIDVQITEPFDIDSYCEDLKSIGYNDEWIESFGHELQWARTHLDEPLAKTWDVDIPKEFKVTRKYTPPPIPQPILRTSDEIRRTRIRWGIPDIDSSQIDEGGDNE